MPKVLAEAAQQGGKFLIEKAGKALSKKTTKNVIKQGFEEVGGTKWPPQSLDVFNKLPDPENVNTLIKETKGPNSEDAYEGLNNLLHNGMAGNDAAAKFEAQDMANPARKAVVQTEVDKFKAKYALAKPDQIRGFNAKVAGGYGEEGVKLPQATYANKGQHFMGKGGPGAITAIHHGFGLDDMMSSIRAHPSWNTWHEGANPIIKKIKSAGYDFGNHEKNLTDVTDTLPNAFRQAEVTQAQEQIESLGGWVNKDTLNDAFGGSKLEPRELDELETAHFTQARKNIDPNLSTEKYMDTYKSPTTGQSYREGSFPDIKIRDENDEVLEVLKIKSAKDHKNRFKLIFDAYERHGRDMSTVRKKFKLKNRAIDPEIDIKGPDHKTIHNIIDDVLKKDPNTAMGRLEYLKANPSEMAKLSDDEMTVAIINAARESEAVTFNVNFNRYQKLLEVFEKYNPGKSFEVLEPLEQQAFFFKHVAEIARKGGVMGNTLTKEQALRPVTQVPQGFRNIFGWDSQVAEMEAWTKEIGETIQPTL